MAAITQPQTVLGENSAGVAAGRRRTGNLRVSHADHSENNLGLNASGNTTDNPADDITGDTDGHLCHPAFRWRVAR